MRDEVLGFRDVDRTKTSVVGGKGANLGELCRIDGIPVPEGFCVSTAAFERVVTETPAIGGLLDRLARLRSTDRQQITELSAELRGVIEGIIIPEDLQGAITRALAGLGDRGAFAVRSSATAEDLPGVSFAGQHDTYLNVVGSPEILRSIRRCWASLFTERAVSYRLQNGFDHRAGRLAVVVQRMLSPSAAGVLFTADPVTGHRRVSSIDAAAGRGDALVSGRVNADTYRVRDGAVVEKKVSSRAQVLTDGQILRLEQLGRRIEAHFGQPQDIEWAWVDDTFHVLQSRPITTLFPIPEAKDRGGHVYISVGHQQMMTAPLRPLGLSFFQLTTARPMFEAGGRLFVDVTQILAAPASRAAFLSLLRDAEPLTREALTTLLARGDFIEPLPAETTKVEKVTSPAGFRTRVEDDPAIVAELIARSEASIGALKRDIRSKSGTELFDFILEDLERLKSELFDPRSSAVFLAAMDAAAWINESVAKWLGDRNASDALTQSVPNNITSQMGLELLDVADVIRRHPRVVEHLGQTKSEVFLDELLELDGGREVREAIAGYLEKYGMRCVGEIDITNPRWSERPATLIPLILSNVENFEPGAGRRRFEQGRADADTKGRALLERVSALPDGEVSAEELRRAISLLRHFIGYREYPKYTVVSRYFVYKQALLREAERLVQAKVIRERDDIYFLTFEELREVVSTHALDPGLVRRRKETHARHERLVPPRVITSDGEIPAGRYEGRDLPPGALVGLAVSSGVVEGRARVLSTIEDADLEPGDILVTTFTDPSWTPLFVSVRGLVTEVGGLMTHGAVIAREYGLPAVVGVENATRLIRDGQRIRVHGTEGYVELLG